MGFPTGTFYDDHQEEIDWLVTALSDRRRFPLMAQRVLPILQTDLTNNLARWVARAPNREIPTLVLAVGSWRDRGHNPFSLLDRLEAGIRFNQNNAQELGNLTGRNFWDPIFSTSILMQLMVTASLSGTTGARVTPVVGNRPDLWIEISGRPIALEVTSRGHDHATRQHIAQGNLPAETGDPREARDDFWSLWNNTIVEKLGDYDGTYPVVLLVWDHDILGDIGDFLGGAPGLRGRNFRSLLELHRPPCTPLSAILYIPWLGVPDLAPVTGLSLGQTLSAPEVAGLRTLFTINPASTCGLYPPEDFPQ